MRSLNRVQVLGNVGRDPSVKTMPDGGLIVSFSVACNYGWKDRASGEKKEKVNWVSCSASGIAADVISKYVQSGDKIYVEGQLTTRKWTDKTGQDRYTTEVKVKDFILLPQSGRTDKRGVRKPAEQEEILDDDIPF